MEKAEVAGECEGMVKVSGRSGVEVVRVVGSIWRWQRQWQRAGGESMILPVAAVARGVMVVQAQEVSRDPPAGVQAVQQRQAGRQHRQIRPPRQAGK